MANEIQITAAATLSLYFEAINLAGQIWNSNTSAFEAYNVTNLAHYTFPLVEPIVGAGIYTANVPAGIPAGVALLPVFTRQSTDPAANDPNYGVTLVLDWSGSAVNSIAPLPLNVQSAPAQLPQPQNALSVAQKIVTSLYLAMVSLATSTTGYANITIDGQAVTFRDPRALQQQIYFWEKKVAFLSGQRRRVQAIYLGGY